MSEYSRIFDYLGHALKFFRKQQSLRQTDIAEMADIDVRHYQRLEAGTLPNVTLDTLYRISTALEVGLSDLLKIDRDFDSSQNSLFTSVICQGLKEHLANFESSNISGVHSSIDDIYNCLFPNSTLEDSFDYSGVIYNGMDYLSPKTIKTTLQNKTIVTGKYNKDKAITPVLTFLQCLKKGKTLFSVHSVVTADKELQIALLTKFAYELNDKPVIIFGGIKCHKCPNIQGCHYSNT